MFSLQVKPDRSGAGPNLNELTSGILEEKGSKRERKEGKKTKCDVYPLNHGFSPKSGLVLYSFLQDMSQDVDDNVAAEETDNT